MSTPDVTVVVTAHDESAVCGPTMRSAEAAIAAARDAGLVVEQIVSLDAPSETTRRYFHQPRFDAWQRLEYDVRDLGKVRNAVLTDTAGRHVAFLDADDLFSENWLVAGVAALDAAAEREERIIAHPEVNIIFDAASTVLVNLDQDDPLFTPHYLYVRNFYDALCLAPREAYLEVPYRLNDLANGLAFEDWTFAVESMTAGWKHVVVPDTIIFKRRRDNSLVTASSSRKSVIRALPGMAIDRINNLPK